LLVINVVIFIYEFSLGGGVRQFISTYGVIPFNIINIHSHTICFETLNCYPVPAPITLFTAMFLHGGLLHLMGNMLFLWIFGNNVEGHLGHFRFTIFYIATGIIASIVHILMNVYSKTPMIGASGAISGILGAYIILYPKARIDTLIFFFFFIQIIKLPAFVFIGIWFLMQVISSSHGDGIAWYAHIGGFLAGISLILLSQKKKRR